MKVSYSSDEWYPVFSIEDSSTRTTQYPDGTLEVSKAFYERYLKVSNDFHEMQVRIEELIHEKKS